MCWYILLIVILCTLTFCLHFPSVFFMTCYFLWLQHSLVHSKLIFSPNCVSKQPHMFVLIYCADNQILYIDILFVFFPCVFTLLNFFAFRFCKRSGNLFILYCCTGISVLVCILYNETLSYFPCLFSLRILLTHDLYSSFHPAAHPRVLTPH